MPAHKNIKANIKLILRHCFFSEPLSGTPTRGFDLYGFAIELDIGRYGTLPSTLAVRSFYTALGKL